MAPPTDTIPSDMSSAPDCVRPVIEDGSGYLLRERDLRFLHIGPEQVALWRARACPLGMSPIQFAGFQQDLQAALTADGIDDCDIRIKGSAAEFFSGHHKAMPTATDEMIDLFRDLRKRVPESWEIHEIAERLHRQWLTDAAFPARRPFDSIYRLSVAREPSDVDLQISSDEIMGRCQALLVDRGQSPTDLRFKHPQYSFIRKDLVDRALPNLYMFWMRMCDALSRPVSVAVFPAHGPPDVSDTWGKLSSHFRETDWVLTRFRLTDA